MASQSYMLIACWRRNVPPMTQTRPSDKPVARRINAAGTAVRPGKIFA